MTSSPVPRAAAALYWMPSLPLLAALAVYATTLVTGGAVLRDPDPYWQVATGQWILTHHAVPHQDIFSYTMNGAPWVVHEWLAALADAVLYGLFGWAGLVIVAALALAAAVALLLRALLRYLAPVYALVGAVTFWGLVQPHALARPHLDALPILVAWTALLVRARAEERAPPLPAALLMVLWANLHGGFLLGDALVAMFAVEMALDQPDWPSLRRQAPGWVGFLLLSLLAGCVTPNGFDGIALPFRLLGMDAVMTTVTEWQSPNFQQLPPLEPWLLLALLGALSFGIRLPVTRAAMLLLFLHMTLAHQRFAEVLGLAAPLLAAPSLAQQLPAVSILSKLPDRTAPAATAMAGIAAALLAFVIVERGVVSDSPRYTPAAAVAYVIDHGIAGPVFNSYNFGGYLIFAGIAPHIDSRAELYGSAMIERERNAANLPQLLAQYGIGWTLLAPDDPRVAVLDHMSGWRRLFADDRAVVHVRAGAP